MTSTGEGDVVRVLSVRRVPMTTTCSTSDASCLAATASAATETLGMVSKAIEAVDASNPTATRIRWAFLNFPPCFFCGDQGLILPVSIFDGGLAVFEILSMEARHERVGGSERKRIAALTDDWGQLHARSRKIIVSRGWRRRADYPFSSPERSGGGSGSALAAPRRWGLQLRTSACVKLKPPSPAARVLPPPLRSGEEKVVHAAPTDPRA